MAMSIEVCWDTEAEQPPARLAAWRSMNAVVRGAKDEWLALFDPEGKGHHGHDGISAFWELTIAKVERFQFVIRDSHAPGNEVANVGTITTFLGGYRVDTDGVFVYRVNEAGLIVSMRAFWETERAMATARPAGE
jgi:steroid delta-isomerase